ncbi:MAG TPA: hypothetical protein VFD45_02625, partial [Patescibacteria group bacterium]|nr:hypothetical protein [Patescibacteria group bacterium]
ELTNVFDTCFLFPLTKFEEKEKYSKETKKIASELLEIFARERIKELKEGIREKEKNKENFEVLEKEFSELISFLPKT